MTATKGVLMHRAQGIVRGIASPRGIAALAAAIAVMVTIAIWMDESGSTARATEASEYAGYPALESNAPTGLPLVSSHSASHEAGANGPTWPMDAPEGIQPGWPVATSIRAVSVAAPAMSVWIAKSMGGGICVLLWAHQPADSIPGVASSCSTSSEDLGKGATTQVSQLPDSPGRVYVAGVVPSSVGSMKVTLADGSTTTVGVTDNAWALETEGEPQGYQTISAGG
jgi:hypothetical protein